MPFAEIRSGSFVALLLLAATAIAPPVRAECRSERVELQMLGTRGPEFLDGRASTGYLIRLDGRARVLVDAGPGTLQRFGQSGANYADLTLLLFTHFHVDHSGDFAGFVKAGFFTERTQTLTVIGPSGNRLVPSAGEFVERTTGRDGVYPYLAGFTDGGAQYRIDARTLAWSDTDAAIVTAYEDDALRVLAVPVHHGPFPAFGYRVELAGCTLAFTGDLSGRLGTMPGLARGAQILVAHNAIPEDETGVAERLHIKPSAIGVLAAQAGVGHLLLTHQMARTLHRHDETLHLIREYYDGPVDFPDDLDRFRP